LEAKAMSAKKAVAKKKAPAGKKKPAKKASSAAARPSKTKLKSAHKPSAKTGKLAKPASVKKVSPKLSAPKDQPKPSGKKTIATLPKKPGSGPPPPIRLASKPLPPPAASRRRGGANLLSGPVKGFTPYQPKRGEEYMNKDQLEHFRQLLLAWKRELMEEVDRTMLHMKDDAANFPDPNDRATQESEFGLELRTRDRERKLLKKIDSALSRIDDGSYGYCEETGDEIGLRRLEARPVATLCVEAQERRELAERQFRDREDQYR
jgi:RNA polymerase-binding transcription factor